MPARDYPDKRVARGVAKEAELRMLSARIDPALMGTSALLRMKHGKVSRKSWQKR